MTNRLSIIIPALNEADGIVPTIERVKRVSREQGWETEVIVVDDGSTDRTGELAREAGAKVLRHPTNGGYGLSLQHGIRLATAPYIAITDADGTYPVEELPRLLRMVAVEGYDMAVGARTGTEYKKGIWKYPARILFRWIAEFVAGRRIPDINSGLRVMRRSKLLPHVSRTCFGFSFTTSITLIFFLNGYFIGYHPIPYAKRMGSSKIRHIRDTLRTMQIMASVIAHYNPIKLFLLVDIFLVVGALILLMLGWAFSVSVFSVLALIWLGATPIILAFGFMTEGLRLAIDKRATHDEHSG